MLSQKRCIFCHQWFDPDPRVARHQKACTQAECQKKRKTLSDQAFWNTYPNYNQGRREKIKQWENEHPDYWKDYRKRHPAYVAHNRNQTRERMRRRRLLFAKQVVISQNPASYLENLWQMNEAMFAKQVVIKARLDGVLAYLLVRENCLQNKSVWTPLAVSP